VSLDQLETQVAIKMGEVHRSGSAGWLGTAQKRESRTNLMEGPCKVDTRGDEKETKKEPQSTWGEYQKTRLSWLGVVGKSRACLKHEVPID
jgi:hypothetical protein